MKRTIIYVDNCTTSTERLENILDRLDNEIQLITLNTKMFIDLGISNYKPNLVIFRENLGGRLSGTSLISALAGSATEKSIPFAIASSDKLLEMDASTFGASAFLHLPATYNKVRASILSVIE